LRVIRRRHRCEQGHRQGHRAGLRQERPKVTIVARHRAEAKAAAKELGGDASAGIADVTNLSEIITEGLESLGPEYHKTMAASVPLKRLGTAEDIGYAALFLASKEAGFITGQTIVVDGGQILPESLEALD